MTQQQMLRFIVAMESAFPSLLRLRNRVFDLAGRIEAPLYVLPTIEGFPEQLHTFGRRMGFGHPHIRRQGDGLCWEVRERDGLSEERFTLSEDEVLYWVFSDATYIMAVEQTDHADGRPGSRVALFEAQLRLLKSLDEGWCTKRKAEIADILSRYPLRDDEKPK